MRRVPKPVWLAILFLFLFWFFYNTAIIDDRKYAQAVDVNVKNPTPENEATVRAEGRRVNMQETRGAATGSLIVTAFVFGAWQVYRLSRKRLRRSS
jgi:hypothetical protein